MTTKDSGGTASAVLTVKESCAQIGEQVAAKLSPQTIVNQAIDGDMHCVFRVGLTMLIPTVDVNPRRLYP